MNILPCLACGQEDRRPVQRERDLYREALQYILETTPKCRRRVNGHKDTCRSWSYEDLEHCPRCVAEAALYRLDEKKPAKKGGRR